MKKQTPHLTFQPAVYHAWQTGINTLVNAIRPTLGPIPRLVAIERTGQRGNAPALFDNGGLIARRLTEIEGRSADTGAMFLRHIIWRVHEAVGDGTATTAVLFQTLFNEGVRYITAGGNAMRLRTHLEQGAKLIEHLLCEQTQPISDASQLTQLARSLNIDHDLAEQLGEIFSLIGSYGRLEIRTGRSRTAEREYVAGSYWDSGILHKGLYNRPLHNRAELNNPHIFLSDWEITTPHELLPLFRLAQQEKIDSLVIIARKIADPVIGLLQKANNDPHTFNVFAARIPGKNATTQAEALEDLSKLTGGAIFPEVIGKNISSLKLSQLGRARRMWADKDYVGVIGGRGNPRHLRQHITQLRRAYEGGLDEHKQARRLARLGRLLGGTAVLHIGAASETELKVKQETAERAARTLRGAADSGLLPGGGIALLNCRDCVKMKMHEAADPNERAAYHILLKALETPLRTIAANAGHDPSEVLARIKWSGQGDGFDARTGEVVHTAEAGIWDVSAVTRTAVQQAIKGAALALTTDVLVHHRHPEEATTP